MRSRFFTIIFFVLLSVGISTSLLYNYFLHQERIRLIDQQVRETATALLGTELAEVSRIDIHKAEDIISEELGENRIGKFFILRKDDNVLYESLGAKILPIKEIPQSPQWVTINEKGQYIRILNLALPRIPNRTLQVGLVIGQDILSPPYFSKNTIAYILLTVAIGLVVSILLTSVLLKPLRRLSEFLRGLNLKNDSVDLLPKVPQELFSYSNLGNKDEYIALLNCFNALTQKINKAYQTSRSWSHQMAHELKTPLAIMNAELEIATRERAIEPHVVQSMREEIDKVSATISNFLNWAEIENAKAPNLKESANCLDIVSQISRRLRKTYSHPIQISGNENFNVKCVPQHFELMVLNLVLNAAKYSDPQTPIKIHIQKNTLQISDRGPGIPAAVKSRIGQPFNFDRQNRQATPGNGLGLAFVYSIANLYGWNIDLHSTEQGTRFTIHFGDTASPAVHLNEPSLGL